MEFKSKPLYRSSFGEQRAIEKGQSKQDFYVFYGNWDYIDGEIVGSFRIGDNIPNIGGVVYTYRLSDGYKIVFIQGIFRKRPQLFIGLAKPQLNVPRVEDAIIFKITKLHLKPFSFKMEKFYVFENYRNAFKFHKTKSKNINILECKITFSKWGDNKKIQDVINKSVFMTPVQEAIFKKLVKKYKEEYINGGEFQIKSG